MDFNIFRKGSTRIDIPYCKDNDDCEQKAAKIAYDLFLENRD